MQAKLSFFLIAAATLATAVPTAPVPGQWNPGTQSCNVGELHCCNDVQHANDTSITRQLGLLGIAVGAVNGLVGVQCNPITVIGAGGQNCNAQPVCCSNNNFNGLVALGCTPINVNA